MRFITIGLLALCTVWQTQGQAATDNGADSVQDAVSNHEQGLYDAAAEKNRAEEALRAAYEEAVPQMVQAVEQLSAEYAGIQERLATAQTSNTGRVIARDPVFFQIVFGLERRPILDPADLAAEQVQARRLDEGLKILNRLDVEGVVGATPTLDALMTAKSSLQWAADKRRRIADLNRLLDMADKVAEGLGEEAKSLPTLKLAIESALQQQTERRAALAAGAEAQAVEDAEAAVKLDAYEAALAAELQWSEQRRLELEAQIERQRVAFEERLLAVQAETAAREASAKAAFDRQMAQLRADQERLAAELRAIQQKADEEIQAIDDDTEKARLIALARRPETQQVLAPFLTEGFWQPGQRRNDVGDEKSPMSWSALVSFGVTKEGQEGLAQLLAVVNDRGFSQQQSGARTSQGGNHHDDDRPKLSYGTNWAHISTEEREELIEMRRLLTELGPTLVELGLLAE